MFFDVDIGMCIHVLCRRLVGGVPSVPADTHVSTLGFGCLRFKVFTVGEVLKRKRIAESLVGGRAHSGWEMHKVPKSLEYYLWPPNYRFRAYYKLLQ